MPALGETSSTSCGLKMDNTVVGFFGQQARLVPGDMVTQPPALTRSGSPSNHLAAQADRG
jgi:hypothetical protein